jgi:predicted PurR-regulated permease PerM
MNEHSDVKTDGSNPDSLNHLLPKLTGRNILLGIFVLLFLGFLYIARDLLLPISIAFLFSLVLAPVVRWFYRRGIPAPVTATAFVAVLLVAFSSVAFLLTGPITAMIADAPRISFEVQQKFAVLREPLAAISRATERIEAIVAPKDAAAGQERVVVQDASGAAIGYIAADAGQRLAAIGLALVLLLFMLAAGDLFQEKLIKVLPTLSDKKKALRIAREIEHEVSSYLFTVSTINAGVGIVTGIVFWTIGMPSPILWGIATALANFLPYIGPAIVTVAAFGIGVVVYDTLWQGFLPPVLFLIVATMEGQIITPMIVGQRHSLNPVAILLSIAFWGWIWGIIGALIAVPMLVTAKVFADYVDGFRPIGEFLSARDLPEPHDEETTNGSSEK